MKLIELADRLETVDVNAFASLLQFEYSHDDDPAQAKQLIIDARRFATENGFAEPRAALDDAD